MIMSWMMLAATLLVLVAAPLIAFRMRPSNLIPLANTEEAEILFNLVLKARKTVPQNSHEHHELRKA